MRNNTKPAQNNDSNANSVPSDSQTTKRAVDAAELDEDDGIIISTAPAEKYVTELAEDKETCKVNKHAYKSCVKQKVDFSTW